ncbi:MAG: retroviral-like aspartic protease family protein [Bacteroidota bacterium]|jgi:clan AA aspartic protease (TIGR02281 family)
MSVKEIAVLLSFFSQTYYSAKAQCISGNCENGYGKFIYSDNTVYEGAFKNQKANGKGTCKFSSGNSYTGTFINDKMDGQGEITFSSGNKYVGGFKENKFHGYGEYQLASGSKYMGKFENGNLNGRAQYFYANGDKFEGLFKEGKRNGEGVLYFKKGGQLKGVWINDDFVSGSDKKNNSIQDTTLIILKKTASGIYEIPVRLNNVLDIDFIFDTGASEVFITPDVALTLIRTKKLTDADLLTDGRYMDANGDINEAARFKIRELQIGSHILKNVTAGISNSITGYCLLGLSALTQFEKATIDFDSNTLKLTK